jgi:hypothetical protein
VLIRLLERIDDEWPRKVHHPTTSGEQVNVEPVPSRESIGPFVTAAQSGNLSIGGIISQIVAGGAGGAILTAIIGAIKNKAAA